MRQHASNGWFAASELMRACRVIHKAATEEHTRWMNHAAVKYVQLRIDQRTGDFIFQDQNGQMLDTETVYKLYPELANTQDFSD